VAESEGKRAEGDGNIKTGFENLWENVRPF
jgi:hypothetical protein